MINNEPNIPEINSKYCTKELGEILYRDKLVSIAKYEKIANIMKRYSRNQEYNESILKDLEREIKLDAILSIEPINSFGYDEKYLDLLNSLQSEQDSEFKICKGITDKGYLEFSNKYYITKDLKTTYGLSIIAKDIINNIVVKNRRPIKMLSFVEAEYINSLNISENEKVLLVGADLGYLSTKHKLNQLYIYEENKDLRNFLKKEVYDKMNLNITYLNETEIHEISFDKIIINPSLDNDLQLKLFYDLKLYKYEQIYTPKLDLIISKFKLDLQDLIMTDKEQVVDSLLEGLKEMKGIGQIILDTQLNFIEKAEKYLNKKNLYFDNYKKYQRFINNEEVIYEILKEEI